MQDIERLNNFFVYISSNPLNRKKLTPEQAEDVREMREAFGEYSAWRMERMFLDGAKDCKMKMSDGSMLKILYFYGDFNETYLCLWEVEESLLLCDSLRRCYDTEPFLVPGYPLVSIEGHIDPTTLRYHDPIDPPPPPKPLPWWKRIRITRDPEPTLTKKSGFTRDTVIENHAPKRGRLRLTIVPNEGEMKEKKENDYSSFSDFMCCSGCFLSMIVIYFTLLFSVFWWFGN